MERSAVEKRVVERGHLSGILMQYAVPTPIQSFCPSYLFSFFQDDMINVRRSGISCLAIRGVDVQYYWLLVICFAGLAAELELSHSPREIGQFW